MCLFDACSYDLKRKPDNSQNLNQAQCPIVTCGYRIYTITAIKQSTDHQKSLHPREHKIRKVENVVEENLTRNILLVVLLIKRPVYT